MDVLQAFLGTICLCCRLNQQVHAILALVLVISCEGRRDRDPEGHGRFQKEERK